MGNLAIDIKDSFFGTSNVLSPANYEGKSGISALVTLFLRISFVLAGLILLFYFILGGIALMSSAGKSDPKATEQARATITSAVIGFVVVFTAYWIVQLIGKLLGIPGII